jgi:catechol 2,3-dioxygenase
MGTTSTPTRELPATTAMGQVGLGVADLDRSADFYARIVGLGVLERSATELVLGAGDRPLVHLVEVPGARPSFGHTGLFHLALRVPRRVDLAAWLDHAARSRAPLSGVSDHFVSEAAYLQDPDGHGIEIYHDRPRDVWEGRVTQMATLPLDVNDLLGELEKAGEATFAGLPSGTDVGHVHLRVADIAQTVGFYRDTLGFTLMASYGPHAVFLAAGGYHHHIGANVWHSMGAPPPPATAAALRYATIAFADVASRDAAADRAADARHEIAAAADALVVHDPAGNVLRLAVA